MTFRDAVVSTFWAVLWFSWVAIIIAALPTFTLGLFLKAKDSLEDTGEPTIPWIFLGLLGGLIGEVTAVASLSFGTWWCLKGDQVCHDGQAGMVLIVRYLLSLFWAVSLRCYGRGLVFEFQQTKFGRQCSDTPAQANS